jgi:hypothetical protein
MFAETKVGGPQRTVPQARLRGIGAYLLLEKRTQARRSKIIQLPLISIHCAAVAILLNGELAFFAAVGKSRNVACPRCCKRDGSTRRRDLDWFDKAALEPEVTTYEWSTLSEILERGKKTMAQRLQDEGQHTQKREDDAAELFEEVLTQMARELILWEEAEMADLQQNWLHFISRRQGLAVAGKRSLSPSNVLRLYEFNASKYNPLEIPSVPLKIVACSQKHVAAIYQNYAPTAFKVERRSFEEDLKDASEEVREKYKVWNEIASRYCCGVDAEPDVVPHNNVQRSTETMACNTCFNTCMRGDERKGEDTKKTRDPRTTSSLSQP